ncbi:MAG: hypothetical protein KDF59_05640, partial [Nitrosomonas sp.]|nr:hypothetical protein [Nitrosomonas sp.]
MVDPEKDILENFYAIISARNYGSSGKCIHADEKNIEGVLVLLQLNICEYSAHKIFCHKAQHAANGCSIGKCCNTVTGYLV